MATITLRSRRLLRRPKVDDVIVCRYGDAKVLAVADNGLRLTVQTAVHGICNLERSPVGWWTVLA